MVPDAMTAPADRPAALTEEEIAALAQKWQTPPRYDGYDGNEEHYYDYDRLADEASTDVAALIADVRRLRGLLGPLVGQEPTVATWGGYSECAFCEAAHFLDNPLAHAADCPWLAARLALGLAPPAPQT